MPKKLTSKKIMSKKSSAKKPSMSDTSVYMHLTAYPGAGKTTLGDFFTSKGYEVHDIDNLFPSKTMTSTKFKSYLETKIESIIKKSKKPGYIIFVGTGCLEPDAKAIPNIDARHKVWLDVSSKESSYRAVKRQIDWTYEHKSEFLANSQKLSLDDFAMYLENYLSPKKRQEDWNELYDIYKKLGYKPVKESDIKNYSNYL